MSRNGQRDIDERSDDSGDSGDLHPAGAAPRIP